MRHWDRILDRLPPGPASGVEVGVLRGENAHRLLMANPDLILGLVEDWSLRGLPSDFAESPEEVRIQAHQRLRRFRDRIWWFEMTSADAAKGCGPVDFVFLDADHSEEATLDAIYDWHPRARLWIGGHDYGHSLFPGVKAAVDTYVVTEDVPLEIAGSCWFIPGRSSWKMNIA